MIEVEPAAGSRRPEPFLSNIKAATLWLLASGAALLLFLVLPLAALLLRALTGNTLAGFLAAPEVVAALQLSLLTTAITLALALAGGTPLAYLLARHNFRFKNTLETLIELPMVLPPAVAGVALLITFGRRGWLGGWLEEQFGLTVGFSTAAVVMAQLFVAAPFYIKSAKAGFETADPAYERVAATLGSSGPGIFWRITVPLALPSLLSGIVLTWARALGEFGATIMFAGSFEGRTRTMPLAIYGALEGSGGLDQALALSFILAVVSFAVLLLVKWLARLTLP